MTYQEKFIRLKIALSDPANTLFATPHYEKCVTIQELLGLYDAVIYAQLGRARLGNLSITQNSNPLDILAFFAKYIS